MQCAQLPDAESRENRVTEAEKVFARRFTESYSACFRHTGEINRDK